MSDKILCDDCIHISVCSKKILYNEINDKIMEIVGNTETDFSQFKLGCKDYKFNGPTQKMPFNYPR